MDAVGICSDKVDLCGDVAASQEKAKSSGRDETASEEADLKRSQSEEEWFRGMKSIRERFIKSSWMNKLAFLKRLSNMIPGYALETVLKSINGIIAKDAIESVCEVRNFEKRSRHNAQNLSEDDLIWFSNLNPIKQTQTILNLFKISDTLLIFHIYKEAEKIFKQHQPTAMAPSDSKTNQKPKAAKLSVNSLASGDSEAGDFTVKKLQMLSRREDEILKYKKLRGIAGDESKVLKKEETKESIDWIQTLPIWLNRKIMSYVDDKSLAGLKKVGKYWAKMIDESITEKTGRKAINGKINKIVGVRPEKMKKKEEKIEGEDFEFLVELGSEKLLAGKKGVEKAMLASSQKYSKILSKKYTVTQVATTFFPDRCGAFCNGTLASSTSNNMVHFYSTKTGARLNELLFDIPASITSLALHEDRLHVFLGCKDGSLFSRNIKTNEQRGSFRGHTKSVLSIFTTTSQLLSASEDNTIKCFQLWSGLCLMCFDLSPKLNISCLLLRNNCSVLGTKEGVLVVIDIKKKECRIKVKLHNSEILQVACDEDILVTACQTGKIRVWDMAHLGVLKPYYNIILESPVSSLVVHDYQIFSGCENGTLKIIPLATGKVSKTMKISSQTTIMGLAVDEDKVSTKLIIWHEGGIEMRTFSLLKSSRNKKSMEKDNRKSKQKAPMKTTTTTTSTPKRNLQNV